ncbi:MAG: thiamine pyrophosphate-dependent dehydrogenase E1 component subunit alpha [Alphaproteobacteria bacterium]|nr:thiamine pyrophosphate-dependent dehydrogenase E1 component subunit alpha [Alphaproteobacteria bacterium]MDP6518227.1 thiamine pyrophosphate-dependent dehydrogenase E1 component subunit alpha [Alphaproteobacteria bacterium]
MHRDIALTKAFNESFVALKRANQVPGPIHQTEGQEAIGVGVVAALRDDDYLVDYYRGMAQWIARGIDLVELAAELLGRDGLCRGKGGEMSFADPSIGLLSVSGIIGGSIPTGVGAAFACQSYGRGQLAAVFFGDGAVNTGAFHEALNMAGLLRVPAVFVCLNNQYGISTYIGDAVAGPDIAGRAAAYGFPGVSVDGNDPVAVFDAARQAVARARAGDGPTLIEGVTFRIGGHSSTNPEYDFMDEAKFRHFRARDPLILIRRRLIEAGLATANQLSEIEVEAKRFSDRAIAEAKARPFPPAEIALEGTFV